MSKILVVEDEAFLLQALTDKLKKAGYEVESGVDGAEGLLKVKKFKPDLLLLDLLMPKKNGHEVLKEVKASEETKDMPVIILSNFGDKAEIKKAMDEGARDYFVKANLSLDDLLVRIRECIKS